MVTKRQENYSFSVKSLTIYDYDTGEPYCVRNMTGGSNTLNISLEVAMLDGGDTFGKKRVEVYDGAVSVDATIREVPMEIVNIANQGSLTTESSCASASVDQTVTNKTGTSVSTVIISARVSAGAHADVLNDKIYVEALSTNTFKLVNYSKQLSSDTLTVATVDGTIVASAVAPGIILDMCSASSFTASDSAVFETKSIHYGKKTSSFGVERVESSVKYVGVRGEAHNASDGTIVKFDLFKCALTGAGAPMTYGDYMSLPIHAEAQVDDKLTTESVGEIELIKTEDC